MSHIRGLNGLRALAVTAVVWHHSPHRESIPLLSNGFLGVDLFFVLSGYLITSLLLQERDRFGTVSLSQFYARRTLRIFPLYYAVLGALALYYLLRGGHPFISELPWHITYASNWVQTGSLMSIGWSLSTEEQFYLVWPLIFAICTTRIAILFLLAFLAANQAVNFGLFDRWISYDSYPILQCTFTPIVLGVLLAYVLRTPLGARLRGAPATALAGLAVLVVIWSGNAEDMRGVPRLVFQSAAAALLAGIVGNPRMLGVRFLELRPVVYVGTISYGVYLLHMIALHFASRLPERWVFVAGYALTIALAAASYAFFERPLLRLKERFRRGAVTPG